MRFAAHITPELLRLVANVRCDANETAFFQRQLEYIAAQTYDVEYPDLKARQLVPVSNEIPAGARSYTYRQYDWRGQALPINDYATDFPSVQVFGEEATTKVKSYGASYSYSIEDMRAAMFGKVNLSDMLARAAREAIERKLETVAAVGDAASGISTGLVNASNILSATVATKTTSNTWLGANSGAGATAAEVLEDINLLSRKIFVESKGKHRGDTLILGTSNYSFMATRPQSPLYTASEKSIMQYVLAASPWLKSIEFWPQLDTAGGSSKERIFLYERNPDVAQLMIAQDFEQFPPQVKGMSFVVPCHLKTAGVVVRRPLACAYMDATVA